VDTCLQSWLIPVVKLARVIQEFSDHTCVPPVYIIFLYTPHKSPADLCSCQGSIDKSSWFFHFKCCLALLAWDDLVTREEGFWLKQGVLVPILFLILPHRLRDAAISVFVFLLAHHNAPVRPDVLPEGQLNNAICCELSSRGNHHLANHFRIADQLPERIIF